MPELASGKFKTALENFSSRIRRLTGKIPRKAILFAPLGLVAILVIGAGYFCLKYKVSPKDLFKPSPGREKVLWQKNLSPETQGNLRIERKLVGTQSQTQDGKKIFGEKVVVAVSNPTDKPLKQARVIEQIPKNFAKSANDLVFDPQPTAIVNDDPVFLWEFEEIEPKGTIQIIYKQIEKLTQPEEPNLEELVNAFNEAIESGEPAIDTLPEKPKEFTSIAWILKTLAEGKEDEVLDKEFYVHGVAEKAVLLTAAQKIAVDLSVKALGWALDILVEGLPEEVSKALGDLKDAALEAPVKFLTEDLNFFLGDLRIEDEISIGEGKVPPVMLAYNFPNGETPFVEPGRVFAGKIKVIGQKGGPKHLQILPGFWYDEPADYIPMYELWPNMRNYFEAKTTVSTIGRVTNVDEKEDHLLVSLYVDGRRYLNEIADDIAGYTLWAKLPKDFSPTPKKNIVLTVRGVIQRSEDETFPIEHKKDNHGYLEARTEAEEGFPPIYPSAVKMTEEYENPRTKEHCQTYVVTDAKMGEIDNWYSKKMEGLGWTQTYGDQIFEFKKDGETFMEQLFGEYDRTRTLNIPGSRPIKDNETGLLLCWSEGEKETNSTKEIITTAAGLAKLPKDAKNCWEGTSPIVMKLKPTKEIDLILERYFQYEAEDDTGKLIIYTDTRRLIPGRQYQLKGCKMAIGTGGPDMATDPGNFFVPKEWEGAIEDLEGKPSPPEGITSAEEFLKLPATCQKQITMQLEIIFTFELEDYNDYQAQDETGVIFLTTKTEKLSNGKTYKLKGCKIDRRGEELFQVQQVL